MISLLADENFNGDVVEGVRLKAPDIDLVTVQELGMESTPDPELLEWAADHGRIVLSHDVQTLIGFAYARLDAGQKMDGVIIAAETLPIGLVIRDILIVNACSDHGEWGGRVAFLPL